MSGSRIDITKKALTLFIQSLPVGSTFDIISFGSHHSSLFGEAKKYDKASKDRAINEIKVFSANFGGTQMGGPAASAFSLKCPKGQKRRVFLLTDG